MARAAPAVPTARRMQSRSFDSGERGATGTTPAEGSHSAIAGCGRGCRGCEVRRMAVCAALCEDELPHLEAIASPVSLGPGRALFGEGDPARHVYIVVSGMVRLVKLMADGRRQITGFSLAGDFAGLSAGSVYPYRAEAVDCVELCQLPVQRLYELLVQFPDVEHRLLDMQNAELDVARERMVLLGRKTPVEKVASFLLEVSARQESWGRPGSPVVLPMARGDIADYLGLTVETVSRCFTRLKGDRSIALPEPTSVALLDRERLQDLAAGD